MNTTYEAYQCESDNRGPNETILTTPDGEVSIRIDIDDLVRNMFENLGEEHNVGYLTALWDEIVRTLDKD